MTIRHLHFRSLQLSTFLIFKIHWQMNHWVFWSLISLCKRGLVHERWFKCVGVDDVFAQITNLEGNVPCERLTILCNIYFASSMINKNGTACYFFWKWLWQNAWLRLLTSYGCWIPWWPSWSWIFCKTSFWGLAGMTSCSNSCPLCKIFQYNPSLKNSKWF